MDQRWTLVHAWCDALNWKTFFSCAACRLILILIISAGDGCGSCDHVEVMILSLSFWSELTFKILEYDESPSLLLRSFNLGFGSFQFPFSSHLTFHSFLPTIVLLILSLSFSSLSVDNNQLIYIFSIIPGQRNPPFHSPYLKIIEEINNLDALDKKR